MDYAEFWVLETAVEWGVPFSRVVGPRAAIAAQWNKPYHDLPRTDMLNLLDGLARNGDIVAGEDFQTRFTPSRKQIDEWLIYGDPRKFRRWYYLTPQGGERWERFSNADWERYHSFEWDCNAEDVLEVAATSPEGAERAYRYVAPWNELRVFPETLEHHTLRPWAATYWKTLPVGYSARFRCHYFEDEDAMKAHFFGGMSETDIQDAQARVRREYDHFSNWYTAHPQTPSSRRSV
jgi:hypothetical protein